MKLELPYPPSINHYYFTARNGMRLIGAKGKVYRDEVFYLCKGKGRVGGKVKVVLEVYPPDKRKRDLDNVEKGLLDSLVYANVIDDDFDIDDKHTIRREKVKGGKIVVTINSL